MSLLTWNIMCTQCSSILFSPTTSHSLLINLLAWFHILYLSISLKIKCSEEQQEKEPNRKQQYHKVPQNHGYPIYLDQLLLGLQPSFECVDRPSISIWKIDWKIVDRLEKLISFLPADNSWKYIPC